jgi:lipoyl(octanoyl) transferase
VLANTTTIASVRVTALPLDFYLVGNIDFSQALCLQRRLAYEVSDFHRPRLAVLFCEHRNLITIGRDGSRSHIRTTQEQLQRQGVSMHWVSRGGGCIPHVPGQLAVYPIAPLKQLEWTVGEYVRRLQAGVLAALGQFKVPTRIRDDRFGIWGYKGLLAAFGITVRNWTTSFGAYVNVNPDLNLFRQVDTETPEAGTSGSAGMSSLLAERRVAVTMNTVRTELIESLNVAFDAPNYHVHAAHPTLRDPRGIAGESWVHI